MRLEIIIIIVYFLGVLFIGFLSYFRIKTPGDYYVAGKKAGIIPVSGSLLATILGGSAILGTIELSQDTGWAALWFLFSAAFGLFWLVPLSKYVKRVGNYTLPEMLGVFYGEKARIIASVIIPVAWLGIVAAQIIAAAKILSGLGVINYTNAALVSGAIFVIYTLAGGQVSILKTDTVQALIIIAGLVSAVVFSTFHLNEVSVESLSPALLFSAGFSWFDLVILILTYSVTFVVGPDIYSRVFCAKNEKTAARSVFLVAFLLIPVSFLLTWLGMFSGATGDENIMSFAHHLLPHWAYGLFIAALLSAVMSSADTTLLTSSMIVIELFTGNLDHKNALKHTRIIIVVFGVLSMIIALFVTSIIGALLFALTFFSGAFVVPVLVGLLNLKVNRNLVTWAIILGGLIALAGKITGTFYDSFTGNMIIIFGYVVNIFLLFGVSKHKKTAPETLKREW
jgi:SSS family solute:Na+ symporter